MVIFAKTISRRAQSSWLIRYFLFYTFRIGSRLLQEMLLKLQFHFSSMRRMDFNWCVAGVLLARCSIYSRSQPERESIKFLSWLMKTLEFKITFSCNLCSLICCCVALIALSCFDFIAKNKNRTWEILINECVWKSMISRFSFHVIFRNARHGTEKVEDEWTKNLSESRFFNSRETIEYWMCVMQHANKLITK